MDRCHQVSARMSFVASSLTPRSLFYMPGTIIGAFVVDLLGPKYTMVRHPSTYFAFLLDLKGRSPDCWSALSGRDWLHHERSLRTADGAHRCFRRELIHVILVRKCLNVYIGCLRHFPKLRRTRCVHCPLLVQLRS